MSKYLEFLKNIGFKEIFENYLFNTYNFELRINDIVADIWINEEFFSLKTSYKLESTTMIKPLKLNELLIILSTNKHLKNIIRQYKIELLNEERN